MESQISKKYQKLDQRSHVLQRPGMYIGSTEKDVYKTWIFDTNENKMIKKEIQYVPGLYKIFDEILVNAIDHCERLKMLKQKNTDIILMKNIKITIDRETGYIEVYNDGDGIEIELHPTYNIYIPELIFGHMLTSTNYDDKEERIIGGTNGLGSKCCNIFSKHFIVETVDAKQQKIFHQEYHDNMNIKGKASIRKSTKKPYTLIKFLPDYERFGYENLTDDMYNIMAKRVYDTCAITDTDINVFFNGVKLDFKSFEKYPDLYIGNKNEHTRVYEKVDDRWEVVASYNDEPGFEQISFVNGIATIRGGKHVDYITNQLIKKLIDMTQKKKKDCSLKPQYIKDNLIIFVKSTIVNPTFDSQTKETLTTPYTKFGSKPELSDKFIEKVYKSGIIEKALTISSLLENKSLKKTDGKKRSIIRGLTKLEDANFAGTNKSKDCTLILTEGLSAKTMAMSGMDEIGRDRYGVYPLKGKLLNVKDCNIKKIIENDEISELKKILGLETGKEYDSIDDLRYGKIMILSDQDVDGSHIKALVFNVFQSLWPSLFKTDGFLTSMLTPIIKVKKGQQIKEFYNLTDYENWRNENENGKGWHIKYYKGLGTSTAEEARTYFKNMHILKYAYTGNESDQVLDLAFNKKRADDRKDWLSKYDRQNVLNYDKEAITFEEFIHKDLIHFSNYDVLRSIPSICDGLKISQRKILYACFKKKWSGEVRVAQLAANVSEQTAYHHGEESLNNAIIGMAQQFVGTNNINLLQPNGQFGSRIKQGKDSASPRYIHTEINPLTFSIFIKDDFDIITYLDDDGLPIEPEYYIPILPMVLINGCLGIGTGFSTNIPCFNPKDIIRGIRGLLDKDEGLNVHDIKPWYMGYKGTIIEKEGKYFSIGKWEKITTSKIRITELPLGTSMEDFKEMLENYLDTKSWLKNYESFYSDVKVDFVLHFTNQNVLDELIQIDSNGFSKIENELKLVSSKGLSISNMYLFNHKGQITKYNNIQSILEDFFHVRMDYYQKRKDFQMAKLQEDIKYLAAKVKFIKQVIENVIIINNRSKTNIVEQLEKEDYPLKDNSFDYLTNMPIYNLSLERKLNLEADLNDNQQKLDTIIKQNCTDMWKTDLDILETKYDAFYQMFITNLDKKLYHKNKKS